MDWKKETVASLKRYLKEHKQSQSGKKEELVKRCGRHAVKCACSISEETSAAQQASNDELSDFNERITKIIVWTASLKDWPELDHSCIVAFKASDKHNKAGYGLFKDNKVENMLVGCLDSTYYCKGRISPSMKKTRYSTVLKFVGANVIWSDCDCPAGKGKCKHAMALLYALVDHVMSGNKEIPEHLACTSQPRQWGRASARPVATDSISNFSDLVPRTVCYDPDHPDAAVTQSLRGERQLKYSSLPISAAETHITRMHTLTQHHPFWNSIITSHHDPNSTSAVKSEPKRRPEPEPEPITTQLAPLIATSCESMDITEDILRDFDDEFEIPDISETSKLSEFMIDIDPDLLPSLPVDEPNASTTDLQYASFRKDLELRTRGQSDSSEWQSARKGRITASIIGSIYKRRETTNPQNLINRIRQVDQQDLSHVKAIQHGRKFEEAARVYYQRRNQVVIEDRGLMLHPVYPWLGASTDGFLADPPSAVEIKCPLFKGDIELDKLSDVVRDKGHRQWFLVLDENESIKINPKHDYYYQCQIQMACLEVDRCLFLVYLCDDSGLYIDSYSEVVHRDEPLIIKLIAKAKEFHDAFLV